MSGEPHADWPGIAERLPQRRWTIDRHDLGGDVLTGPQVPYGAKVDVVPLAEAREAVQVLLAAMHIREDNPHIPAAELDELQAAAEKIANDFLSADA